MSHQLADEPALSQKPSSAPSTGASLPTRLHTPTHCPKGRHGQAVMGHQHRWPPTGHGFPVTLALLSGSLGLEEERGPGPETRSKR